MKTFVFTKEWLAKELGVESLTPEQESALLASVAKEAKLLTEGYFGALKAYVPADGDSLCIVVERLDGDVDEEMFQSLLPEIEQAVDTEVFGLVCRELPTPPLANKSGLWGVVSTYSFDPTSSTMVLFHSEFDAIMYLRKCFFDRLLADVYIGCVPKSVNQRFSALIKRCTYKRKHQFFIDRQVPGGIMNPECPLL